MKKILIRTKGKTYFIALQDIIFCKASGSYCVIFMASKEKIITSVNLLNMYKKLQVTPAFLRVSQSFIVNLNHVRCVHHTSREIELVNGTMIPYTIAIKELEQQLLNIAIN